MRHPHLLLLCLATLCVACARAPAPEPVEPSAPDLQAANTASPAEWAHEAADEVTPPGDGPASSDGPRD